MANLRLLSFTIIDSTHLSVKFNFPLNQYIETSNVLVLSETSGIQDSEVLDIKVSNDTITVTTQPLVFQAAYFIYFISTENVVFNSLNKDATILNDGVTNRYYFTGPVEQNNPIKNSINTLLKDNVYDLESPSVLSKYIDGLSLSLSQALYSIGQTKNNNYLSFTVLDELKTRGEGAYDRLNQEGAYEIIRVAKTPTRSGTSETITVSEFPSYPVSLLSTNISENITTSNSDSVGVFNLKTLTINCTNSPAIILNSVTFVYNSVLAPFIYDKTIYGYQAKTSLYDPDYAFTYVSLEENQIRLNDQVLNNSLFSLEDIASITIDYQYKDKGKIISASTLALEMVISSGRETLPAIENIFNLSNAPIVKSNNTIGEVGDIQFLDPNAYPGSNTAHPAFVYELPFRLDYLPSRIGEYSIDYTTGTVYVFGDDKNKTGTGAYPPLAIYLYRHTFQSDIDYVYDETELDVVAIPNGSLTGLSCNISYSFEKILIKDIDYKCEVHNEELAERIENRLLALNVISPSKFPITNVFRIFNETSGEIYKVSRWNSNKVFFTYTTPPNILNIANERVSFDFITNETLFISTTTSLSLTKKLYKIYLLNNNIISASEDSIGYSENTSLFFSDSTIFSNEFYYDSGLSEAQNNTKIVNVGDYQADYLGGIIWIVVSSSQDLSIGTASYKRGYIRSEHPHIITVNDLYCKLYTLEEKTKTYDYTSFTDTLILPSSINVADESLLNSTSLPYQVYNGSVGVFESAIFTAGVSDYVKYLRGVFEREDLLNSPSPLNFSTFSTFSSKNVSISNISYSEYHTIEPDGYTIYANTNLPYISSNITIGVSVIRLSDSAQLWDISGNINTGSPFNFALSGTNSPVAGDSVLVTYTFTINNLSRVIIDYSRGDYLVDYSYLADEIILSYEYGDNVIDFSKSNTVSNNDIYYVSYKAGALRTALLNNFGTLIDIPILNNLNVDFNRERYRDALIAAMQSFTAGPTIASLSNIVSGITHIPPEIIESTFSNWSLGTSLLTQEKIEISGDPEILPAKYNNGILISEKNQSVSFPIISNLRLEEGTIGMWVIPQWNGIDNQALLEFEIVKDGYRVNDFAIDGYDISSQKIFIGPAEDHPEELEGFFLVDNTSGNMLGMPNKNKDGIYVYMLPDSSNLFNRWYVDVVDGYADGYIANTTSIKINTNGKFYDIKKSADSISSTGVISSGQDSINYKLLDYTAINEGITFTADYEHYLFDTGITNVEKKSLDLPDNLLMTELGELLITQFNESLGSSNINVLDTQETISAEYLITESGELLLTELGESIII